MQKNKYFTRHTVCIPAKRNVTPPLAMRLAITPLRLDFDHTVRIDRRWPETYGIWWEKYKPKEKAKPYVRPEKNYTIDDAYWIDENGSQVRDLDVDFPMTLYVVLAGEYSVGASIDLDFENKDKDDIWRAIRRSGTVNSEGIVVLENFNLKPVKSKNNGNT